jgi:hypothetical protein
MMSPDTFYLVWKSGGDAPTKRHELIESAREEARRLAHDNPCIEFFVMRTIEGVTYTENPWRMRNFKKQKEAIPTEDERTAARHSYPITPPTEKWW